MRSVAVGWNLREKDRNFKVKVVIVFQIQLFSKKPKYNKILIAGKI